MEERNFGYLGQSFQQSLIKSIIEDRKFGDIIIDVLDSKYFDNSSFRFIIENIKELHKSFGKIPDYATLCQKIMSENGKSLSSKIHIDTIEEIKNNKQDIEFVKDRAMNFCKQQNLKKELKLVQTIIENGEFEEYLKIEEIIQNALKVGISTDDVTDVFENMEDALSKTNRNSVPTGIVGLDNLLKGGLGRGELGVILAPTGVGKTTILTKFANAAASCGFNVLQIFFEDSLDVIKRKHYTIWTGMNEEELDQNKEEAIQKVNEIQSGLQGNVRLKKLLSGAVSITEIKSQVRKLMSDGFKIDLLIIDYVDCISPEKNAQGEDWKGEAAIMRSLDAMSSEFDIAIWTATQGNRGSISSEVVTTDQMGGSIKKAQIGHVIVSIARTNEQKEHKLANVTLLKSRIGRDGITFDNCKFDNEYLIIDTETQQTLLGFTQDKEKEKGDRAKQAFLRRQEIVKQQ
jgi:replicative DNA helicase